MNNIFLKKLAVRDNAVLLDANTLVSITEIESINLLELEQDEKLKIFFQYRYFIRSLNFPVQITLRFVNKDTEKALYRKRMANVEEAIKENCKHNLKDILAECDEFKDWLRHFLEMLVRPMLLCYFVVSVQSSTNLHKNQEAYVEALQLLNQRTAHCISRLSSIRFKKRFKLNEKRSEWEKEQLEKIQEKKSLIALKIFKRKENYYSLDSFKADLKAQKKIADYTKHNFFEQIFDEKEEALEVKRLDDSQITNLIDSYSKDFVVLNEGDRHKYISMRDLFDLWMKS